MTDINGNDPHPSVAPVLGDAALPDPMHPVEQAIRAEIGIDDRDAAALLAVLDLHKPTPDTSYLDGRLVCNGCGLTSDEDQWPYPCETVERIADALGVTP